MFLSIQVEDHFVVLKSQTYVREKRVHLQYVIVTLVYWQHVYLASFFYSPAHYFYRDRTEARSYDIVLTALIIYRAKIGEIIANKAAIFVIYNVERLKKRESIYWFFSISLQSNSVHENSVSNSFLFGKDVPFINVEGHVCEFKIHVVATYEVHRVDVENNKHGQLGRVDQA